MYRVIILILMMGQFFRVPLNPPYLSMSKNRTASYDTADFSLSPLPSEEFVQVYEGPDPEAIYLRLQAGDYEIVEPSDRYIFQKNDSVIIQLEGFLQDNSPGDPALPYQVYPIALPPDALINSLKIEIIHLVEKEISGRFNIVPAPPYFLIQEESLEEQIRWGEKKEIVDGHNILIYDKNAFHPVNSCQVASGGQLRKWKVATIKYFPIRYNPIQSNLFIIEEMIIKLNFERDSTYFEQTTTKELLKDFTFDERAKNLLLNYDQAKNWYITPLYDGSVGNGNNVLADNGNNALANFTIITTSEIYDALDESNSLDEFCFHKRDLGFTVVVVTEHQTHTVEGTSGSYTIVDAAGGFEDVVGEPPNGRAEKIRQWLIENYIALGIEYVLLIGNPDPDDLEPDDLVGDIPMQFCVLDFWESYPTDMYYSDLSGNWNLDGDDYIGETFYNNPDTGYTFSNIPEGVTEDQFCVQWNGVVEVSGVTGFVGVTFSGHTDGPVKIWFDKDKDGINQEVEDDVVFTYDDEGKRRPQYFGFWSNLDDGIYPIIINFIQSIGDVYFELDYETSIPDVSVGFKHDDGTGTYVEGLEANYFNDNDFSPPTDVEQVELELDLRFIGGGDRGLGGVDFYPEVIVGRIPFYGEDKDNDGIPDYGILDSILTRIIDYETADIHEETWRRRILFSASHLWDHITPGEDYRGAEYLMEYVAPPPLWEWYRIHEHDYPDVVPDADINDGCTIDAMVAAWNNPADPDDGRGVVMWQAHGNQTAAQDVFHESRCVDLDDSKPSIVLQMSCQNGHPDVEEKDGILYYPLGYSLLKTGAIATISASRNAKGGIFDIDYLNFEEKYCPFLMYYLAKGIFDNIDVGDVLAHAKVTEATYSYTDDWIQILVFNLYGDPSLSLFGPNPKSNNDIVFLLDGSGSMLTEGKWDAAVDATVLYYELMQELRHPAFYDRYGTVVFRWDNQANMDISTTVPPSSGLQEITVSLTSDILNAERPESYYFTPIGEGLSLAVDLFNLESEESFYSNKVILLLSDGKHNRGTNPLFVDIDEEIVVHSIGLGEDYIEPDTISDIAASYRGDFRISPSPREMEDFFVQIFCDTSWKLQDVTVTSNRVPIDENMAVFIIVWDDPDTNVYFNLNPPGTGPEITPTSGQTAYPPMEVTYHAPAPGATHAFYVCKNIPEELFGDWYFSNLPVPLSDVLLKVVEDPQTIVDFDIENIDYYTGQSIVLTAKVTENGLLKTGLSNVYAELIRSPAYSVGTIMAENSPSSSYPYQPSNISDRTLRSHYLLGVMENMGIDSLSITEGPRIYLRDDGLGCDSRADDGIYTGYYTNTGYEGSYCFKFRARGENSDGVTFDRTETLAKYVKFGTSPFETSVEFISTVPSPQENFVYTTVRVTPRNANGSYLGPFLGDAIHFWTSEGEVKSDFVDNLDGSYDFTLTHLNNVTPQVSISVNSFIVAELVSAIVPSGPDLLILVLLVSFVAIVIIIIVVRVRKRK
jgi:hypothetical protein